jgi:flagellar protein FlbD
MIERIEERESTVLLLENGKKYIVDENADEIIKKIVEFESKIVVQASIKKDTQFD